MSRKSITKPFKLFDSVNIALSQTSQLVNVENLDQGSIKIHWSSASISGELFIEARNGDKDNWQVLDFDESMLVNVDNDYHIIVFNSMPFKELRLKYTASAGTGSMDAILLLKTVGA
jgi:hypothetical protein